MISLSADDLIIIVWRFSYLLLLGSRVFCVAESSLLSACSNTFSARTDLSPLSQLGNTSFSNLITRIGFSDSRILPSTLLEPLNHNFGCCWHCSLFHGSWGPIRDCSFFHGSLGPVPGCFSFFTSIWHVFPQTYYSLLGCFIVASGELSAHPLADSFSVCLAPVAGCDRVSVPCSKHALLNAFSCIAVSPRFRVSLHAILLSFVVRWLRRKPSLSPPSPVPDACFLSFVPILGFGSSILPRSFASSRLTVSFWSSSSTSCYFLAAPCATSRLVCSSSSILW